ncbi:TraB/GumN family protein [Zavarzinia compransoris]|uniref:TraB/GumN family protein n=1 Tax=Zavarzinia compransoris TaxID=1264899 RepID=UPI0010D02F25|nr:TraB/GumN family protein [Zavarzinia compransoris]TDP40448.1 hypothetical protein DES42_11470 [Zavarzinia compransoris]
MKSRLQRLLPALALLLLAAAGAGAARAEPALWRLRDADSTIYLFGTIHLLQPGTPWQTPKIRDAFAGADELWLEADVGLLSTLGPTLRYGLSFGEPLDRLLTPADLARVHDLLVPAGLSPGAINRLRPWLIAIMISTLPSVAAGFDMAAGADMVLEGEARARKIPIHRLESVSDQLRPFAELAPADEIAVLRDALDALDHPEQDDTAALAGYWLAGDEAALAGLLVADPQMGEQGPLYQGLIVDRNAAWTRRIEERLAGSGISFIAVGAGHLVGPDSVIEMLAARGLNAERF